jgi:ATP-binding cassette subfamily F protein 3
MVKKGKEAGALVEEHPGGGHITVTAQQSRYALDAVDAPASKEVRCDIYVISRSLDPSLASILFELRVNH